MSRTTRGILLLVLVAYVAGLSVITLWPSTDTTPGAAVVRGTLSDGQDGGMPEVFSWSSMEKLANVLAFIPIGALVVALTPSRTWIVGAVAGLALSALIESTQFVFLPDRDPSWRDLILNSIGALVGAALITSFRATKRLSRDVG